MMYARKDLLGNVTDVCTVPLAVKEAKDAGIFSGYASVFDIIDYHADVILPGAFRDSLKQLEDPGMIPILWQHDPEQRIGYATNLQEDATGLYIEGQLLLYHEKAISVYKELKRRRVQAMSIGYQVRSCYEDQAGVRYLQSVQLKEISIVCSPANQHAQILSVKATQAQEWQNASPDVRIYRNLMAACERAISAIQL